MLKPVTALLAVAIASPAWAYRNDGHWYPFTLEQYTNPQSYACEGITDYKILDFILGELMVSGTQTLPQEGYLGGLFDRELKSRCRRLTDEDLINGKVRLSEVKAMDGDPNCFVESIELENRKYLYPVCRYPDEDEGD